MGNSVPSGVSIIALVAASFFAIGYLAQRYPAFGELLGVLGIG